MSDTPRTDSMQPYLPPYNEDLLVHVPKTFARQLERELNKANKKIERMKELLTLVDNFGRPNLPDDVITCIRDVVNEND